MATFTVWKFDSAEGAEQVLDTLQRLQKQHLIDVQDAAVVKWPADKKKPKTWQLRSLVGAGTLGGAFWGMLFGLIFLIPLFGLVVGAAAGAISGSLRDVGIDDEFIEEIKAKVTPGTSALFLLSVGAVKDKINAELGDVREHVELIHTNLSPEEEQKLLEAFSEED